MGYYAYVLRSEKFQRDYIGFTSDPVKRLADHNNGRTKSTKPCRPRKLLFYESFETKIEAINREKFLKSGQGRDYVKKYMAS